MACSCSKCCPTPTPWSPWLWAPPSANCPPSSNSPPSSSPALHPPPLRRRWIRRSAGGGGSDRRGPDSGASPTWLQSSQRRWCSWEWCRRYTTATASSRLPPPPPPPSVCRSCGPWWWSPPAPPSPGGRITPSGRSGVTAGPSRRAGSGRRRTCCPRGAWRYVACE